jgi:hypothetical protein
MGYALTIQEVYCFAKLYFRIASDKFDFVVNLKVVALAHRDRRDGTTAY